MRVTEELKRIINYGERSEEVSKYEENLSEEFLSFLHKLTKEEVGVVAMILAERFPDIDTNSMESDLPRVGENLSGGMCVRKVERREDTRGCPYWVVGMANEEKQQTKKVAVIGDKYKISWRAGSKWNHSVVDPVKLRDELAKIVGKQ